MGLGYARNAIPQVCICVTAACWAAGLSGCGFGASRSNLSLESPDPSVRVMAIIRAADRGDPSAVPLLVDRLEDEDAAVRLYAILALDRLTGSRLGYRYGVARAERRASVDRWRRFVTETRDNRRSSSAPTVR